jgi:S-DNA-T family DNA segregation ATPase FtsK/SpoIIIE
VADSEIRKIVKHLKEVAEPQYHPELTQLNRMDPSEMMKDELFDDAVRVVLDSKRGSVSLLQRRLNIGYARASRIIEMMASVGVLGEYKGSQAREVMMTTEQYEQLCVSMEAGEVEYEPDDNEDIDRPYTGSSEGEYHYAAMDDEEE